LRLNRYRLAWWIVPQPRGGASADRRDLAHGGAADAVSHCSYLLQQGAGCEGLAGCLRGWRGGGASPAGKDGAGIINKIRRYVLQQINWPQIVVGCRNLDHCQEVLL
jgi:hypothetical protein